MVGILVEAVVRVGVAGAAVVPVVPAVPAVFQVVAEVPRAAAELPAVGKNFDKRSANIVLQGTQVREHRP